MMICPKCKTEYRDGSSICSECGEKLIDCLERSETEKVITDNGPEVFLINAEDDAQANIIESLLRAHDIPVMRKYKGSDGYMSIFSGRTLFGISLYVPQNVFDTALEIIKETHSVSEEDDIEEDLMQDIKARKAKTVLRIIAISMIAFVVVLLIMQIFMS